MTIGTEFMTPVLQNQEYNQREASAPAELAQKIASTRYTAALADRVESETAADRSVAAQMAKAGGLPAQAGGTGSQSEFLSSMASMYAAAGAPAKAAEYAKQASTAAAQEGTLRMKAVQEAASQAKLQGEQFKMASGLLGSVTDADSWQKANDLYSQQTGQPSPFKDIPYDPKVVKLLQDATETAYQKHQLQLREADVKLHATDVASKIQDRSAKTGIAVERLRVTQQREERLAKSGGKDIGSPGKTELSAADKLLGDTGLEGDERDAAAFSIASEARVLRRKNPGVSADEALRQAKLNAIQNGSFVPGEKNLLSQNIPAKFSPPTDVKPLPANGTTASLVKGHTYADGKGNIATWDGKGWANKRKGAAPAAKAAPTSAGSSDDEEEDDDE